MTAQRTPEDTSAAEAAYAEIARIAEQHGLILNGSGGVLTIVHPSTAKEHGVWASMQYMAGLGECPGERHEVVDAELPYGGTDD